MLNFLVRILKFKYWISHDKWVTKELRNKGYRIIGFRNHKGIAEVQIACSPIIKVEDYY